MRRWDIYNNEENSETYNNWLLFSSSQVEPNLWKNDTLQLKLHAITALDSWTLLTKIKAISKKDPIYLYFWELDCDANDVHWLIDDNRFLHHEGLIYIPEVGDLCLQVLKSKYNHKLTSHLGQTKTYQLVYQDYSWPNLRGFVTNYI